MKTYKYAWNKATFEKFEENINKLGAIGWQVIFVKWFSEDAMIYYIVEKAEITHD